MCCVGCQGEDREESRGWTEGREGRGENRWGHKKEGRFVRYLCRLTEGGQFPCNPNKKEKGGGQDRGEGREGAGEAEEGRRRRQRGGCLPVDST